MDGAETKYWIVQSCYSQSNVDIAGKPAYCKQRHFLSREIPRANKINYIYKKLFFEYDNCITPLNSLQKKVLEIRTVIITTIMTSRSNQEDNNNKKKEEQPIANNTTTTNSVF